MNWIVLVAAPCYSISLNWHPNAKCATSTRLIFWMFYFALTVFLTCVLCFVEDVLNILKNIFLLIKGKLLHKSVYRNQECQKIGKMVKRNYLKSIFAVVSLRLIKSELRRAIRSTFEISNFWCSCFLAKFTRSFCWWQV